MACRENWAAHDNVGRFRFRSRVRRTGSNPRSVTLTVIGSQVEIHKGSRLRPRLSRALARGSLKGESVPGFRTSELGEGVGTRREC